MQNLQDKLAQRSSNAHIANKSCRFCTIKPFSDARCLKSCTICKISYLAELPVVRPTCCDWILCRPKENSIRNSCSIPRVAIPVAKFLLDDTPNAPLYAKFRIYSPGRRSKRLCLRNQPKKSPRSGELSPCLGLFHLLLLIKGYRQKNVRSQSMQRATAAITAPGRSSPRLTLPR